jgi:small subunit ribosomal protein S6
MFILDPGQYSRDPQAVSGQIPRMIEECGGEVLVSRLWDERRLAYPIRRQRKGTYWLTYFRVDGSRIAELTRQCQLSDSILRHLFVKIDRRIVDALVEHARSVQSMPSGGRPSAPSSSEKKEKEKEDKQEAVAAAEAPADSQVSDG